MATVEAVFLERKYSATATEETMTEKYLVEGTTDPLVAALAAGIPTKGTVYVTDAAVDTLMYVQEYKAETIKNDATNDQERCIVYVIFKTPPAGSGGGSGVGNSWELDLTTTQQHITHVSEPSLQVHYPEFANDAGQAIGVTLDSIDGVDIEVPQGAITITNYKPQDEVITEAYLKTIEATGGHVNAAPFLNLWQEGEALYLGARLGFSASADNPLVRIDHHFKVEPNLIGFDVEVSTGLVNVDKKGWDYLWFRNTDVIEEEAGVRIKKRLIKSAHVATVYKSADFEALNVEFASA